MPSKKEVLYEMKITWIMLSLLIPTVLLSGANAATPTTVAGSFTTTAINTGARAVDGNLIVTQTLTITTAGDLAGTLLGSDTVVLLSSGNGTFFGTGTFTGTVLGRTGSSTVSFTGTFTGFPTLPVLQGHTVFYNGTGGLSNFEAQGTIQGILNVGGTYSITVLFT
ncbi:MAG TPA: hypothetical protein VE955_09350 [Candidatus Dormibacteraeota bacterium]|nr:hypothetical protein [Candidatus Dormibacteraeota bacterium]